MKKEKEKKPRKQRGNRGLLETDDLENVGTIESRIELEQLVLKNKRWKAHLKIGTILPRSFHRYNIKLDLDEKPYTDRIEELERDLNSGLFKDEKISRKSVHEKISGIRKELEAMAKECEHIEFSAVVEEIKYRDGDTLLAARIPDDVIEALNRQKYRMEAYKIALVPIFA